MGWLLQCLLVTLTTTTAYDYDNPYYGHVQPRRVDHDSVTQELHSDRMNERSISVSSGIQRVQEKERRRIDSYGDEPVSRSGNVSYKIVNSPKQYPSVATRRGAAPDSVVFPGRTSAGAFELNIPPECEKLGICENLPDYPEELVKDIIAKLPKEKLDLLRIDRPEPEIAQRIGPSGDSEEIELCGHREQNFLRPMAQKDIFENWQLILNDRTNPVQGYRVEMCLEPNASCATNVAFFYDGYTSKCKQKYTQRLLATVDKQTGEPIFNVPFRVPTCCSCVAVHNTGL